MKLEKKSLVKIPSMQFGCTLLKLNFQGSAQAEPNNIAI